MTAKLKSVRVWVRARRWFRRRPAHKGQHRLTISRRALWRHNRDLRHRLAGTEWFAEQLRADLTTCSADLELEQALRQYTDRLLLEVNEQLLRAEAAARANTRATAVAAPRDVSAAEDTVETPIVKLDDDPPDSITSLQLVRPYAVSVVPLSRSPLAGSY